MKCPGAFPLLLLVLVASLLFPQPAQAHRIHADKIKVGDGTAASCTEAAFRFALAVAEGSGGGTIRFNCGPLPVSIVLTEVLIPPDHVTIDGDGLITLNGRGVDPSVFGSVVFVSRDTAVVLKDLSIIVGGSPTLACPGLVNEGHAHD